MLSLPAERGRERGSAVTHNHKRPSAQAHLLYTNTKASLKHLAVFPPPPTRTHIPPPPPPPLQHNPSSSLHFHQNIADEVLSSINHSAALLYCPPINHQAHHTAGPGRINLFPSGSGCVVIACVCTPKALAHTHISDCQSCAISYLRNGSRAYFRAFACSVDSLLEMKG